MTQVSLIMAECRAAMAESASPVTSFDGLQGAYRLKIRIGEIEQEIKDRHAALDDELADLHEQIKRMTTEKEEILQKCVDAGIDEENGYELKVQRKSQNGKLNRDKLIEMYPKVFDKLKKRAIEDLEDTYSPTLGDVRKEIKKLKADPEEVIFPGQSVIIGYDVSPVMPERSSAEVEL